MKAFGSGHSVDESGKNALASALEDARTKLDLMLHVAARRALTGPEVKEAQDLERRVEKLTRAIGRSEIRPGTTHPTPKMSVVAVARETRARRRIGMDWDTKAKLAQLTRKLDRLLDRATRRSLTPEEEREAHNAETEINSIRKPFGI